MASIADSSRSSAPEPAWVAESIARPERKETASACAMAARCAFHKEFSSAMIFAQFALGTDSKESDIRSEMKYVWVCECLVARVSARALALNSVQTSGWNQAAPSVVPKVVTMRRFGRCTGRCSQASCATCE